MLERSIFVESGVGQFISSERCEERMPKCQDISQSFESWGTLDT